MKVLILDAPGLLYPTTQPLPNADPIQSGVMLARKMIDAMALPVLMCSQADSDQLKSWCKAYDVFYTWQARGEDGESTYDYWDRVVLTLLGQQRANAAVCLTADERVAVKLAATGIPTAQFRQAGGMPDWAPRASSWENAPEEEA